MAKASNAQKKCIKKYYSSFDSIKVRLPKGTNERIKNCSSQKNVSQNTYLSNLILEAIERDEKKK